MDVEYDSSRYRFRPIILPGKPEKSTNQPVPVNLRAEFLYQVRRRVRLDATGWKIHVLSYRNYEGSTVDDLQ